MARILLVEDDRDVRLLLEDILAFNGYDVTSVESMANGLALLETQTFDLVVTDVNLPDGLGLKVADKATEIGVRALVVTGYGLSLKPGSLAGYDYLFKPIAPSELLIAISQRLPREEGNMFPLPKQT